MAIVKFPPRTRIPSGHATKCLGSRVTTGDKTFVEGGDGRSAWARRWKDLILAHANDLGGIEMISEAQLSICRRAGALECELESIEMSASQPFDIELYARLARTLARLFELIGIKRLTKPLDPTSELARALEKYAEPVDEDEDEPSPLVPEPGEA
jgi:hypothetical protein